MTRRVYDGEPEHAVMISCMHTKLVYMVHAACMQLIKSSANLPKLGALHMFAIDASLNHPILHPWCYQVQEVTEL